MRKDIATRLETKGVPDADWLQELYQRCTDAITQARIDRNVSEMRADVS